MSLSIHFDHLSLKVFEYIIAALKFFPPDSNICDLDVWIVFPGLEVIFLFLHSCVNFLFCIRKCTRCAVEVLVSLYRVLFFALVSSYIIGQLSGGLVLCSVRTGL